MSKRHIIELVLLLVLTLWLAGSGFVGCGQHVYPVRTDREIWISEDPFAYFTFGKFYYGNGFVGEILIDDTLYKYYMQFDDSDHASLELLNDAGQFVDNYTSLLLGDRFFYENELHIKVNKTPTSSIYAGYYDELIFVRYAFDPENDELPKPPAPD